VVSDLARSLFETMKTSKPEDLWNKVRDLYEVPTATGIRADSMNEFRKTNLKLAIEAALESYGTGGVKAKMELGEKAKEFMGVMTKNRTFTQGSEYSQFAKAMLDFFYKPGQKIPLRTGGNLNNTLIEIVRRLAGDEATKPLLNKVSRTMAPGYTLAEDLDGSKITYSTDTSSPVEKIEQLLRYQVSKHFSQLGFSGEYKDMIVNIAVTGAKNRIMATDFVSLCVGFIANRPTIALSSATNSRELFAPYCLPFSRRRA